MIIAMRIKVQGFLVFDYVKQYASARKELAQWLAEGKIQRKETIIKGGLGAAEKGLMELYNGVNTGKWNVRLFGKKLTNMCLIGKLLVEVKADSEGVPSRL
jgi:NADPH-dependent curcumin reductase CurA